MMPACVSAPMEHWSYYPTPRIAVCATHAVSFEWIEDLERDYIGLKDVANRMAGFGVYRDADNKSALG